MSSSSDFFQKVGDPGTATTLSAPGYTIGDTSINIGSTANWPSDTGITIAIDEAEVVDGVEVRVDGTYNEYRCVVATGTSANQLVWARGDGNRNYAAGALTRVYIPISAERENRLVEGILEHSNQDGTLITQAVRDALSIGDNSNAGWEINTTSTITAVTNNGNRSYTLTHSASVAAVISEGMRRRFTRTVAANTYMGGLFNGSSHYFTKTTPSGTLGTVTNNFTIEAYVQPTVYQDATILARADAAINNSISLVMRSSGVVRVIISNTAAANFRLIDTYQSLPLNKKTHVAASWTSGTVVIYFDGVAVPVSAAATGGTAPTTAGTGGDFSIGRRGASAVEYFPGYISNVAVFDAVLSAATIREHAKGKLLGNETNCIGAWSLDNTPNDQNSAGNNLTATGGVGFSNVSPFGNNGKSSTLEYGLTMSVSSDGLTEVVQVPEGCALPTAITSQDYSTQGNPFGFPTTPIKILESILKTSFTTSATSSIVDISGHSIPYTATGRETLRFRLNPYYYTSDGVASTFLEIMVRDGTTAITTTGITLPAPNYAVRGSIVVDYRPTAGAHTFVASLLKNQAGTLQYAASASTQSVFSLEIL